MKILMVWDGSYPWDVRVEKVCKTLISAGHDVHLVCRNAKGETRRENHGGINVRRTFAFNGRLRVLNGAITFPAFFSPLWLHEIRKSIKEVSPDVVIIRDLPMALGALFFTKIYQVPTVLDMAECYPEMIRCAWQFEKFRISNIFVRNPIIADWVEKITLKNVDMTWAMIEESAERLQRKGVSPSKIRIVSNTPLVAAGDRKINPGPILRITYTGLINPSRGLVTVVEAARILRDHFNDFEIKIVGAGKDLARVTALVEKYSLQKHVHLTGWIDHKALGEILLNSDIGLVPHYACSHWNNTIPNKIFDYMNASIPVIVSDAKPTKRIVDETCSGLSYANTDATDLAEKIMRLRDQKLRGELGDNGYRAIKETYNWERDRSVLLDSLEQLTSPKIAQHH